MRKNGWYLGLVVAALCAALAGGTSNDASAQTRARGGNVSAAVAGGRATAVTVAPSAGATGVSGSINLNTATSEELQRLPGVGPAKAEAILALRQRLGRFQRIEDVLRVRGIGRATFRRLRPMMTLQGATTLAEAQRARAPRVADEEGVDPEAGAP